MRYICIICLLFTVSGLNAQDSVFFGLGSEINAITRDGIALGGVLSGGVDLNRNFALGLRAGFFYDFDSVSSIEASAFFRYYLPFISGPFVQAEAGTAILLEDSKSYPSFLGGLAAGWRFVLGKRFYIEPAIRGGYPHIWGVSLTAALRFAM